MDAREAENSPNMIDAAKSNPIYGRKLRLAIFGGRGIPSTYSGTETFFIELAPRLVERGHDVIVYCRKALFKERPPVYKGVRLIYTSSIETKNFGTFTHTLACMMDVQRRKVDAMLITNVANAFHCAIPRILHQNCALNVDGIEWKRGKWGDWARAISTGMLGSQERYFRKALLRTLMPCESFTWKSLRRLPPALLTAATLRHLPTLRLFVNMG